MKTTYTDKQLLDRVKSLPSFKGIPKGLWLIAVRSKEDLYDQFDDKMYLFDGEKFILGSSCTTNPGGPILTGGWKKYTNSGAAVIKADEIYYDAFQASDGKTIRHHNGRMPCLRQIKNLLYFRDKNNDKKTDEVGKIEFANYATNIHFNSYSIFSKVKLAVKRFIGEWSAGCQVWNVQDKYETMYSLCKAYAKPVSYALLKEF